MRRRQGGIIRRKVRKIEEDLKEEDGRGHMGDKDWQMWNMILELSLPKSQHASGSFRALSVLVMITDCKRLRIQARHHCMKPSSRRSLSHHGTPSSRESRQHLRHTLCDHHGQHAAQKFLTIIAGRTISPDAEAMAYQHTFADFTMRQGQASFQFRCHLHAHSSPVCHKLSWGLFRLFEDRKIESSAAGLTSPDSPFARPSQLRQVDLWCH